MPFVAPATWTKRSRRVAGSFQVRTARSPAAPARGAARTAAARRSRRRAIRRRRARRPATGRSGGAGAPSASTSRASAKTSAGGAATSMPIGCASQATGARRRSMVWRARSASAGPRTLVERHPAASVGRAVELVAQVAADDADAVDDADRVHPARRAVLDGSWNSRSLTSTTTISPRSPSPRAARGRPPGRGLAELEAAAGQRPEVPGPDGRGDVAEQDAVLVVAAQRVRGDADRSRLTAQERARKRGSRARPAGTRSPITRPIVARTSGRAASRRRRTRTARAGEERLDEPRDGVLRREPAAHRPVVGGGGPPGRARPGRRHRWPAAASSAETRARWRPSPVNGSRNPAASPTRNQPGPPAGRPGCRAGRRPRSRR